jgi:sugar-specific transcriptional regulator TrmB
MNTSILAEIGLTPGEIKTYLALLKLGSTSTGPLAKESGVSRSKLYAILDKLEKKGLAGHVEKQGVIHFSAVEPSKVQDLLTQKEQQLQKLKQDFETFLPQLEAFHKDAQQETQVTVYQGLKGLQAAHEHTYLKLKHGEKYYYLGVPAYQPKISHFYWKRDHERRQKTGVKANILFNADADPGILKQRNSYKGCDARFMPIKIQTPAMIFGYKDTTCIAIQHPIIITIEIVNQQIADSFKAYFDAFWKMSKKR